VKSEYRKKQEAKERVFRSLQQTKKRLGIGPAKPLRGATPSPLVAKTWQRKANPAPTSDRIPGPAHANDFMHAHKWKRGRPRERGYGKGNSPEGVEDCARVQQGRSAISAGRLGPPATVSTEAW